MNKISANGDFLYFPGISVISFVDADTRMRMKGMIEFINNNFPTVMKYMSLLDPDSFHITISNIFAGKKAKESVKYIDRVDTLIKYLKVLRVEKCSVTNVNIGQAVSLTLNMKGKDNKLMLSNYFINGLFGIIPGNHRFHVTIGYLFNPVSDEDRPVFVTEVEKMNNYISEFCGDITFENPQLVCFRDMNVYKPVADSTDYLIKMHWALAP